MGRPSTGYGMPGRWPARRGWRTVEVMDEPQADAAYLVSGATLDDEPVGPLYADAADAHRIARTAIAGVGGTVRILRDSPAGWLEVARYTDTGRFRAHGAGMSVNWSVTRETDHEEWPVEVSVWSAVRSGVARTPLSGWRSARRRSRAPAPSRTSPSRPGTPRPR